MFSSQINNYRSDERGRNFALPAVFAFGQHVRGPEGSCLETFGVL